MKKAIINVCKEGTDAGATENILERPLEFTKGVGPKRAGLLKRLMLENVSDLLHFFPRSYKDRATITKLSDVKPGEEINVYAQIIDVRAKQTNKGKIRLEALLQDETGQLYANWWSPYIADKLTPYGWALFTGRIGLFKSRVQMESPEFEVLTQGKVENGSFPPKDTRRPGPDFGRIVPQYSLRPKKRRANGEVAPAIKLKQSAIRQLLWGVLTEHAHKQLGDDLPESILKRRQLMARSKAVAYIHFPDSIARQKEARRRLAYEELFLLTLGVALRRAKWERMQAAMPLPLTPEIENRILSRMPFTLTNAQTKVFREIADDTARQRPMNRLLQGDVGCGKTAVATATMLLAVAHGAQAVMLAPTEVLAVQHFHTLQEMLKGSQVNIGLLRGGAPAAERKAFLSDLAAGEIHIAVGTHALLEPSVTFKNLPLIIVDEQHKFGVEQRKALRSKGSVPHVLVMTATPIPRTISLTLYGDLEISTINEMPPGRSPVKTKWLMEADRSKLYGYVRKEAQQGKVTYIVLPRIDEISPDELEEPKPKAKSNTPPDLFSMLKKNEVKGVEEELKRIKKAMPDLRIVALHGRMKGDEKNQILSDLRDGKIDVLVSTQIIEVGIDLPQASVIVIENAERFGLASLHQLRGRVGRSARAGKSYCFFFGDASMPETVERLSAFEETSDGFEVAEADFKLRGPGQFFGTQQSGMPEFLVADLIADRELLMLARKDAIELVKQDPQLKAKENQRLRKRVLDVLGERLDLIEVG